MGKSDLIWFVIAATAVIVGVLSMSSVRRRQRYRMRDARRRRLDDLRNRGN